MTGAQYASLLQAQIKPLIFKSHFCNETKEYQTMITRNSLEKFGEVKYVSWKPLWLINNTSLRNKAVVLMIFFLCYACNGGNNRKRRKALYRLYLWSVVWYQQLQGCDCLMACLLTYCLTHSMEQSTSWKANLFPASQEILRILWNPKVHHRVYNSPLPVRILSQINPVDASHPTSWRSVSILFSHICLGVPSGLFPLRFHTKTLYAPLLSPIRATCPAHFILIGLITRIILGEEYRSFSSSEAVR